jgi:hypothetical protein
MLTIGDQRNEASEFECMGLLWVRRAVIGEGDATFTDTNGSTGE